MTVTFPRPPSTEQFDTLQILWTGGACYASYSSAFFPDLGRTDLAAQARRICGTCSVTTVCGDYAVDYNEPHGIWGGMTVKERRRRRMA